MASEKLNPPLNLRTALITIASFLTLGAYGYHRETTSDNSIKALDLQSRRKIERLEAEVQELKRIEKDDFERIQALESQLEDVLRALARSKSKPRLESPANDK